MSDSLGSYRHMCLTHSGRESGAGTGEVVTLLYVQRDHPNKRTSAGVSLSLLSWPFKQRRVKQTTSCGSSPERHPISIEMTQSHFLCKPGTQPFPRAHGSYYPPSPTSGSQRKTPKLIAWNLQQGLRTLL